MERLVDYLMPALAHTPVVIQQTTDWWAVGLGALATLAGAFGGAWLGAKGAYRATVRAGRDITRQSKIEEALCLIDEIQREGEEYLSELNDLLFEGVEFAQTKLDDNLVRSLSDRSERVYILLRLHANSAKGAADRLRAASAEVELCHSNLKTCTAPSRDTADDLRVQFLECDSKLCEAALRLWDILRPLASTTE